MDYETLEAISLSTDDVQTIIKNATGKDIKIVKLPSIKPSDTLEKIFGKNDAIVLYVPVNSKYSGHFQMLLRDNGNLFFGDSYGNNFSKLIEMVQSSHPDLGDNFNLGKIIMKSKYYPNNVFMNTQQYQTYAPNDDTCGRYASAFIICKYALNKLGKAFDFNEFKAFIDDYKNRHNLPNYDDCVIEISEKYLQNKNNNLF